MILTDEQIKADDERWKCRDVKQELRYLGYATPTRTSVTNDDIKFVACMARKALRMIEALEPRVDNDGTLWITVASLDELDKISRVIVESGTWCKQFYMDGQPEIIRCKDCKFGRITTDGRFCKYCELDTDDEGRMNELYIDANFFCGFAERREL